ncbi:hypothetical protein A2U01_0089844, partial [Trifolium medium]|nr:hypothetical protein [Trifolium medium]
MESFPAPNYDPLMLSDILWKMDLSTQADVDIADSYDTSLPFWHALMARHEQVPAYFYLRYPTMADFDAAHERRI